MAIVTISHEMGAGGPEIGQQLAQQLGYRYIDHELISDAAQRYGLLEDKLAHLDETKPSLFERFDAETRRYITVMQTTLFELAEQDRVVLMGRGGQWLLRGLPHVLRVRITASIDLRVKRLAAKMAGPMAEQASRRTVMEMIRRDDRDKAGRMRYLYDVDIRAAALYDLVISTDTLSMAATVEMIAGVMHSPAVQTTEASAQLIADRALASRVQVALATHPETRKYRISVEAQAGLVTLEGTASLDEARAVAGQVPGVWHVKAQQLVIPPVPL
jgi:cytidylate kinase